MWSSQLVQDLVHLERGQDGLDQYGGLDRSSRDAKGVLRADENIVPEPGLEMALQLRQIEIRPGAAGDELPGVVKKKQSEIEESCPTSARRRRRTCFSTRCQPRGRTSSVAVLAFSR